MDLLHRLWWIWVGFSKAFWSFLAGSGQVHQGSLLDSMMRPIKSVKHEGGVEYGGPVQEKIDTQMRELEERHHSQVGAQIA